MSTCKPDDSSTPRHPGGRPTKYTIEIAEEICRRLANGESLLGICADKPDYFPERAVIYQWLDQKPEFLDMYKKARAKQADSLLDECARIADDGSQDIKTKIGRDGREYEYIDHEHINRSRLRVETRLRMIEKLAPRKYGTKLELSGDSDSPLKVCVNIDLGAGDK